jgi:methylglutaconyl-CoA hydratase
LKHVPYRNGFKKLFSLLALCFQEKLAAASWNSIMALLLLHPSLKRSCHTISRRWRTTEPQILVERLSHTDREGHITQVTLNRPKANAMGSIMLTELLECLETLESDSNSSRCVILTSSSPKVFSAGADLKERRGMTQQEAAAFVTMLRNTMQRVAALPQPIIAAIEGVAVGGGLELALAADLRIASSTATLGFPETSLAIIPGAGGTQRLPRLIGVSKAKELIWTGRRVNGDEAYNMGLVDRVVEPGQATDTAIQLAWEIAAKGPIAIRASKEAMDRGLTANTMDEALEMERQCYAKILPTKDRMEGLAAFQEGRTPNYKGE